MIAEFGHQALRNAFEGAGTIVHLTGKLLRDAHMATLAEHVGPVVTELHLRNNQIGDEGLRVLTSVDAPNLEYLSLSSNVVGDEGAVALVNALKEGAWPRMRQLYLGGNKIGNDARAALRAVGQARDISLPYL